MDRRKKRERAKLRWSREAVDKWVAEFKARVKSTPRRNSSNLRAEVLKILDGMNSKKKVTRFSRFRDAYLPSCSPAEDNQKMEIEEEEASVVSNRRGMKRKQSDELRWRSGSTKGSGGLKEFENLLKEIRYKKPPKNVVDKWVAEFKERVKSTNSSNLRTEVLKILDKLSSKKKVTRFSRFRDAYQPSCSPAENDQRMEIEDEEASVVSNRRGMKRRQSDELRWRSESTKGSGGRKELKNRLKEIRYKKPPKNVVDKWVAEFKERVKSTNSSNLRTEVLKILDKLSSKKKVTRFSRFRDAYQPSCSPAENDQRMEIEDEEASVVSNRCGMKRRQSDGATIRNGIRNRNSVQEEDSDENESDDEDQNQRVTKRRRIGESDEVSGAKFADEENPKDPPESDKKKDEEEMEDDEDLTDYELEDDEDLTDYELEDDEDLTDSELEGDEYLSEDEFVEDNTPETDEEPEKLLKAMEKDVKLPAGVWLSAHDCKMIEKLVMKVIETDGDPEKVLEAMVENGELTVVVMLSAHDCKMIEKLVMKVIETRGDPKKVLEAMVENGEITEDDQKYKNNESKKKEISKAIAKLIDDESGVQEVLEKNQEDELPNEDTLDDFEEDEDLEEILKDDVVKKTTEVVGEDVKLDKKDENLRGEKQELTEKENKPDEKLEEKIEVQELIPQAPKKGITLDPKVPVEEINLRSEEDGMNAFEEAKKDIDLLKKDNNFKEIHAELEAVIEALANKRDKTNVPKIANAYEIFSKKIEGCLDVAKKSLLTKVYNDFVTKISAGYCCGKLCSQNSDVKICPGEFGCLIQNNEACYSNGDQFYCQKHFDALKEEAKKKLKKTIHISIEPERYEECEDCRKVWHPTCRSYLLRTDPGKVECRRNSDFHEIKNFSDLLKPTETTDMMTEVYEKMRKSTQPQLQFFEAANSLVFSNYRSKTKKLLDQQQKVGFVKKTILASLKFEELDTIVFSMIVHEYSTEFKKGWVTIDYLDSIKLFDVKSFADLIIGAYLESARRRGFTRAHFLASAPKNGQEYLFNHRPDYQHVPDQPALERFYKKLLNSEGVLHRLGFEFLETTPYLNSIIREERNAADICRDLIFLDDYFGAAIENILLELKNPRNNFDFEEKFKSLLKEKIAKDETRLFFIKLSDLEEATPKPFDGEEERKSGFAGSQEDCINFQVNNNIQFNTIINAQVGSRTMMKEIYLEALESAATSGKKKKSKKIPKIPRQTPLNHDFCDSSSCSTTNQ